MSAEVVASINAIELQMRGGGVTCPAALRLSKESVHIVFGLPHTGDYAKEVDFEFVLVGGQLRLIVRDMAQEGVVLSNIIVHDFSKEGGRLKIQGEQK